MWRRLGGATPLGTLRRLGVTTRIALCLGCLTASALLMADTLGLVPDERAAVLAGRSRLCESLAINFSILASRGDLGAMEEAMQAVAERNRDLLSMAVRRADGSVLASVRDHGRWTLTGDDRSTETQMVVPIFRGHDQWGRLEARFPPPGARGGSRWSLASWQRKTLLVLLVTATCILSFRMYLRRVLAVLNPSKVVPSRVRSALDAMAEGLVVLDEQKRIVLANEAFARTSGLDADGLVGRSVEDLPWRLRAAETDQPAGETSGGDQADGDQADGDQPDGDHTPDGKTPVAVTAAAASAAYPWSRALAEDCPQTGVLLDLPVGEEPRTFLVNATPIRDNQGVSRGVLASFDDITPLEQKKAELAAMLATLRASTDEIRRQNRELERLATQDPLTGCFNRRSFFEQFNTHWKSATRHGHPLSCVMVDVDHFKSINDKHGHTVGDQVLQRVAAALKETVRESDVVCRYGGEEFAVLLPFTPIDEAAEAAERLRAILEQLPFRYLKVTASLGVSTTALGAADPQGLLDQADKCLYVAKRNGRNQVVRFDDVPADIGTDETTDDRGDRAGTATPAIPFQAVTALISALAFRDAETAEHSRRVADLCVAVAEGLMPLTACYVLETAALLHDIGKIGVPDSILLKPGPLTESEWQAMRRHQRIGVEIVKASFASETLATIVANYELPSGGDPLSPQRPRGADIPLGARILAIADAYDAMVTDRAYRSGRDREDAFAELRRCAGTQFDPVLVEQFIGTVRVRQFQPGPVVTGRVPKQTALDIGLQIEHLATALENHDLGGLQALAGRLHETARKHSVHEIAEKAAELGAVSPSDSDLTAALELANELIGLCRQTQSSYITRLTDVEV